MFKLDEITSKKKETTQVLDLSKSRISSKEDFEKVIDRVPEYKIKPEKVRLEDLKIHDNDFSFQHTRKDRRQEYFFADPVPPSMKSVRLEDLSSVDINWRMLTVARPKTKLEEEIFSRLVELGKLELKTIQRESETQNSNNSTKPTTRRTKGGHVQKTSRSCKECGEEFCNGMFCIVYPYDNYIRVYLDKDELEAQEKEGKAEPVKEKKHRKKKKKKSKKKKVTTDS